MTMDFLIGGKFQFEGARLDPLSPAVTPIELIANNQIFGHGTGFIWAHGPRFFLVTNWHNFSGQHPFDGTHLSEVGRVPDSIRYYPILEGPGIVRSPITTPLFEQFDLPLWQQHKRFDDLRIDIAVIEIPEDGTKYYAINRFPEEAPLFTHVGSDLFIVGYPFSDFDHQFMKFPIWKRGSLASETLFGWQGKPAFLIDAASRPGMSGSPVIRKVFGPAPISLGDGFGFTLAMS